MLNNFLFFNLGGGEIILVVFIVLLLFGSKKIPELARAMGKGINEFKRATSEIQREIQTSAGGNPVDEVKKEIQDIKRKTIDPVTDVIKKDISGEIEKAAQSPVVRDKFSPPPSSPS
ncbi:MAG: twin-arginine translocase TatA/TatE family subunit [Bacteroidetes bacterium]|nr:twin-arginine translocase TatA/TatE family subunit [Bacteroidota bacterium]